LNITSLKLNLIWGLFKRTIYLNPWTQGFGSLQGYLFMPIAKARDIGLKQTTSLNKKEIQ